MLELDVDDWHMGGEVRSNFIRLDKILEMRHRHGGVRTRQHLCRPVRPPLSSPENHMENTMLVKHLLR